MSRPLRVVICFRSPYGGLFRHVVDLTRELSLRNIEVGLVFDEACSDAKYLNIKPELSKLARLGVQTITISRQPGLSDISAIRSVRTFCRSTNAQLIHGHGAKGGLLARLAGRTLGIPVVYTPHGGSLHYENGLSGALYLLTEKLLSNFTDAFIFESHFAANRFHDRLGKLNTAYRTIHNGLNSGDFVKPDEKAAFDFVFLGELRKLKGVETFLRAIRRVCDKDFNPKVAIYGDGPDAKYFRLLASRLKLENNLFWAGATDKPKSALASGSCVVIPSHRESLPYTVLEAAGMNIPVIATNAGGINEIFGPELQQSLVNPGDSETLAKRLMLFINNPSSFDSETKLLNTRVKNYFCVSTMATDTVALYKKLQNRYYINHNDDFVTPSVRARRGD